MDAGVVVLGVVEPAGAGVVVPAAGAVDVGRVVTAAPGAAPDIIEVAIDIISGLNIDRTNSGLDSIGRSIGLESSMALSIGLLASICAMNPGWLIMLVIMD